ncbi:uncharacterized protein LOC120699976 [Panicum virgatum]|uniref:Uncharacterized protein n=1 Tax=Panicum virgatum TaxID=38727 RepID=A0A8T0VAT9_PANVG|nr:uncharacterized protein LOC120699976 [Panicum virgatum]KAG2630434.1 hypothetical protein PVAP13_3KG527200 [Panicum virgatum]
MSSTTASTLAGAWLGELAAAVQGGWQAVAAGHRGRQQQQRRKLRAGPGEQKHKAPAPAPGGAAAAEDGDVGRRGGAMSDTTVYLLLDRFAPS